MRSLLRPSVEADMPTILNLHARAFSATHEKGTERQQNAVRACLTAPGIKCSVLEAEATKTMQGFVAVGPRPYSEMTMVWDMLADRPQGGWPPMPPQTGYICELAVDPSAQKHGLGSLLLCVGLDQLRAQGLSVAIVFTGDHLKSAVALYERFGFRRMLKQRSEPGVQGDWWWWVLENDGSHTSRARNMPIEVPTKHAIEEQRSNVAVPLKVERAPEALVSVVAVPAHVSRSISQAQGFQAAQHPLQPNVQAGRMPVACAQEQRAPWAAPALRAQAWAPQPGGRIPSVDGGYVHMTCQARHPGVERESTGATGVTGSWSDDTFSSTAASSSPRMHGTRSGCSLANVQPQVERDGLHQKSQTAFQGYQSVPCPTPGNKHQLIPLNPRLQAGRGPFDAQFSVSPRLGAMSPRMGPPPFIPSASLNPMKLSGQPDMVKQTCPFPWSPRPFQINENIPPNVRVA